MINDHIGNTHVGLLDGSEQINIDFLLLFIDYTLSVCVFKLKKKHQQARLSFKMIKSFFFFKFTLQLLTDDLQSTDFKLFSSMHPCQMGECNEDSKSFWILQGFDVVNKRFVRYLTIRFLLYKKCYYCVVDVTCIINIVFQVV